MIEYLHTLLDSSTVPMLTAIVLGLLTAISPCPLFTNITAVSFICKDVDKHAVFNKGICYCLGRIVAYTCLGVLLIYVLKKGGEIFGLQNAIHVIGEYVIGPILILIGLFMLFGHLLHLPKFGFSGNVVDSRFHGVAGSFLLGFFFAMAFCPTSAMFYFGMLIPLSVGTETGYFLPIFFAIATALPVLIVAWILAFCVTNLSTWIGNVQKFQKWLNSVVSLIFMIVGLYYTIMLIV